MTGDELLTDDQAEKLNRRAQINAVRDVLFAEQGRGALDQLAEHVIAAYRAAPLVSASQCPDVHPKFGQCVREYGHAPYVIEKVIKRDADGASVRDDRGHPVREDAQDVSNDGHYTTEYKDDRRPDGSHPYDY